jgi:hypothetical protein
MPAIEESSHHMHPRTEELLQYLDSLGHLKK